MNWRRRRRGEGARSPFVCACTAEKRLQIITPAGFVVCRFFSGLKNIKRKVFIGSPEETVFPVGRKQPSKLNLCAGLVEGRRDVLVIRIVFFTDVGEAAPEIFFFLLPGLDLKV